MPGGTWLASSLDMIQGDKMLAVKSLAVLFCSATLLLACATAVPPNDILSPEKAMIYGYIEADYPIDSIDLQEFGVVYIIPFKRPPRVLVYDNGYFMAENLKPGRYFISAYNSNYKTYKVVDSPQSTYQNIFTVKPGSLKFIGSHKIVVRKRTLLGHGEFEVIRLRRPDERSMLRFFYEITEGTAWQKKIVRRLKGLRQ